MCRLTGRFQTSQQQTIEALQFNHLIRMWLKFERDHSSINREINIALLPQESHATSLIVVILYCKLMQETAEAIG